VGPAPCCNGPEPFLLDDAVARLTRALFPGQTELSLARETLDARAAGAEGIVQAALTLPWLGDAGSWWRAARTAQREVRRGARGLREGAEPVHRARAPGRLVLDGTHWLLRALPAAAVVPAPALAGRALATWLRAHAQAVGYELRDDAATLLVELSGDDLTRLVGEVEKARARGRAGEPPRHGDRDPARWWASTGCATCSISPAPCRRATRPPRWPCSSRCSTRRRAPRGARHADPRGPRDLQAATRCGPAARPREIARSLRRPPAAATALLDRARTVSVAAAARQLARCWDVERRLKLGGTARPELSLLVADLCAV